jgi:membrane-associated phospholipid phosphatase
VAIVKLHAGVRVALILALFAVPAAAQPPAPPAAGQTQELSAAAPDAAEKSGTAHNFVVDVAHDYRNFISWDNGLWLGVGGLAALAAHQGDEAAYESVAAGNAPDLPGGDAWGSSGVQLPLAVGWWVIGHAVHNERASATGRDLLRAQISVVSWTYAIKIPVNRTRPNGESHSFPSGHASNSFAAATILQAHYGWKLGVPAFAAAAYTAASRVTDNQHWVSDVVFGAALGVVSARTVTLRLRETRVSLMPVKLPGGAGVVVALRRDNE